MMNPDLSSPAEQRRAGMSGLALAAASGADVSRHLESLAARIMVDECLACPLGGLSSSRVPFEGGPSSIMFVGEAPGADEAELGRPFVGRSGQLLRESTTAVGINEFAIGNTICCRPPQNDYDQAINAGAPEACQPHLARALDISGAWIIVAVGGKAAAEFGWGGTVSSAVGKWRWVGGRLVTTIWHPAYLLRRGGRRSSEYKRNLEVLKEVYRVSQGMGRYTPPAPYTPQTAATIKPSSTETMVRNAIATNGWVPIYSNALGRNVVVYDSERVTPASSLKLPPGFNDPVWFTVDELARLKKPLDVQRVAALKDVLNVEVVA